MRESPQRGREMRVVKKKDGERKRRGLKVRGEANGFKYRREEEVVVKAPGRVAGPSTAWGEPRG